ncbi:MAG: hypothetical protein ACI4AN_06755 [Muribaculaceae bacterium]
MKDNEETYWQFTERIKKEMAERRLTQRRIAVAFYIALSGIIFGIIPYIGWPYLIFSFCYGVRVFRATRHPEVLIAILISSIELALRYLVDATP